MNRAVDYVRRFAPKARAQYVAAFEAGDALFSKYGVTTPLRLAHFLAQVMHETGGLTVLRESGSYSAKRIVEVFGVGRHSARVTQAEAAKLARKPSALFERVYGLGNPKKAKELGNTKAGDGWRYRGNGIMQTTGRYNHRAMGQKAGLGDLFEDDPGKVTAAEYALIPALVEWQAGGCNALADANNILAISRVINLGNAKSKATPNGMADRRAWFNRLWPAIRDGDFSVSSAKPADPGMSRDEIKPLQKRLRDLGYFEVGLVDGLIGKNTRSGIRNFQEEHSLPVTEAFDDATIKRLATAGHRQATTDSDRSSLTAKDLSKAGDTITKGAEAVKKTTVAAGASAAVIGIAEQVGQATDMLYPITGFFTNVPGWVWAALAVGVAVALWQAATKVERTRLRAVQTGEDAGPA
ncbi:peptidoglycan-binding protein [Castellaniella sp.]|uniref:peptidoglycan-binding protein n=1 Tax=Castellaniella sp. TaxID=1955812 RepID=UPI002AFF54EC|nr:peptidoglycan-binding protein [Castellaniella sp.]